MTPTAPRIVDSVETSSRGFVARLQGASLGDLIQMECLRGARQVICVSSGTRTGYLFFDQGQVIHASSGEHFGEGAVFQMMSWTDGSFVSVDRPWPLRPTIQTGWQMLLIEAMRRDDEAKRESVPDSGEALSGAPARGRTGGAPGERPHPPIRGAAVRPATEVPGALQRERSSSSLKKTEEGLAASDNDATRYGLLRAVRIDEEGQTVSALGEVGDLADVSSYVVRLARLIGTSLQLDAFVGLECKAHDRTMLVFPDGDTVVALEAEASSNIDGYRKRAGF